MQSPEHSTIIPNPNQFRAWIIEVTEILCISPWKLGQLAALSNNAIRKFMDGVSADTTLSTASKIESAAQKLAKSQGVTIPGPHLSKLDGCSAKVAAE